MTAEVTRPDPEKLLQQIHADELRRAHGRLKVFLGYAAGVGKTFAMLEAAHQRQAEGTDVVVGIVETHGRFETEALLSGLEVLPLRQVSYRGTQLSEMDLDGILRRRPALALIDELAHTNVPESRHPKRYQDVAELLENGIDVYTTLNIQHLESLNDVVQQITGVKVREKIPNRVLDAADEIEVIDLPPDELLGRMKAGKVYIPDQARRAMEMFFRKGNLTALREISLRHAAERVDTQMLDYMERKAIPGPWPARERILVAIGEHPQSERLVRAGRRLAQALNAEWQVVHVETSERLERSPKRTTGLIEALRLAEELGAQIVNLPGATAADALLDYARKHNVTKIILGKTRRSRWNARLRRSIPDEVLRGSGPIDVYVLGDQDEPLPGGDALAQSALRGWLPHPAYRRYLYAALVMLGVTLIALPIQALFHPANLVMIFLAGVVVTALYFGRGPSVLASFLGVLIFDFVFIDPKLTLVVADTQYLLTFLSLLVVGLLISGLTARVRDQVETLQADREQTQTLYSLSRDLTTAAGLEALAATIIEHVGRSAGRKAVVLLPQNAALKVVGASPGFELTDSDLAIATWAFEHAQPTGRGAETLPASAIRFQPMKTTHGVLGILGVQPEDPAGFADPAQRQLVEAYAGLGAVAIERAMLEAQAGEARLLRESERLQSALLNSISHDLRTPLATISGVLDSIYAAETAAETPPGPGADGDAAPGAAGSIEARGSGAASADGITLDHAARLDLLETAREEARRLNRLVGNLLDMTRLEAGALKLNRAETELQDLVSATLSHLRERLGRRPVRVELPEGLPPASLDFLLMEQALVNLLDNAIKYSAADNPIEISARLVGAASEAAGGANKAAGGAIQVAGGAIQVAGGAIQVAGGAIQIAGQAIEIAGQAIEIAGQAIEIAVADRGAGIAPENLERVFDKFFRIERRGRAQGTGLGLAICRGIIEAHGGRIWAENRPGGGTVMRFRLPVEDGGAYGR